MVLYICDFRSKQAANATNENIIAARITAADSPERKAYAHKKAIINKNIPRIITKLFSNGRARKVGNSKIETPRSRAIAIKLICPLALGRKRALTFIICYIYAQFVGKILCRSLIFMLFFFRIIFILRIIVRICRIHFHLWLNLIHDNTGNFCTIAF